MESADRSRALTMAPFRYWRQGTRFSRYSGTVFLKACNMLLTPPASSIIPTRTPPPPHPPVKKDPAVKPPYESRDLSGFRPSAPSPVVQPQDVQAASALASAPSSSSSSSLDITSETDFPPLKTPLYTMSGRQSKPRVRLNL